MLVNGILVIQCHREIVILQPRLNHRGKLEKSELLEPQDCVDILYARHTN